MNGIIEAASEKLCGNQPVIIFDCAIQPLKAISYAFYSKVTITAGTKAGTAKITVTTKTKKSAVITVTVPKAETTKIKCKGITVKKGKKKQLKPVITPIFSDDKITYKVKDKKIAKVSKSGVVKGKKKGKTTVTITS